MFTPVRLRVQFWLLIVVVGAALLLTAAPVAAAPVAAAPLFGLITKVEEGETSPFEWSAPFSLWRWVTFVFLVGLFWFLSFNVLMLSALSLDNPKPPRPKEAFARFAGLFCLFVAITFVFAFAILANDLYRKPWVKSFPPPLSFLNYHLLWIGALILGISLMFLVRYVLRR